MSEHLYVAFLVGLVQVICGILALLIPEASHVTILYLMYWIAERYDLSIPMFIGTVYCTAGWLGIAAYEFYELPRWLRKVLLIPQYAVLALQLISINIVVANGVYPDGYAPHGGSVFIFWDQVWAWLFSFYPLIDAGMTHIHLRGERFWGKELD